MNRSYQDVLEEAVRGEVSDELDLFPAIAAIQERKTIMRNNKVRSMLTVFSVLLALSLVTTAVYAVSRKLGYIPGVGLVEPEAGLRELAAPVSEERDGITLTVNQAVLSAENTVLSISVSGTPWEALSHQEDDPGCIKLPSLSLPDGTELAPLQTGGSLNQTRLEFPPISADAAQASFHLPCIPGALAGMAPENWVLDLVFQPGGPTITIIPVVEITPAPSPTTAPNPTTVVQEGPFSISDAISIADEVVLMGSIHPPADGSLIELWEIQVTDANGEQVFTSPPDIEGLPGYDWGLQFQANQAYPLRLAFTGNRISAGGDDTFTLDLDMGQDPLPDQEWVLNQSFSLEGRTLTLVRVLRKEQGYRFEFATEEDIAGFQVEIAGFEETGGGGGGYQGSFSSSMSYSELPTGELELVVSNLTLRSPLDLMPLVWSPEDVSGKSSIYGIQPVLDQVITTPEGTYLVGRMAWTDQRISAVIPAGPISALDASGAQFTLQPAEMAEISDLVESIDPSSWVFRLEAAEFQGSLDLKFEELQVSFLPAPGLVLDLSNTDFAFDDQHLNLLYKTGLIPLDLPGLQAMLFNAAYIAQDGLRGFELGLEADPSLTELQIEFADSGPNGLTVSWGSSFRDPESGLLMTSFLGDGQLEFPLALSVSGVTLRGSWELSAALAGR